MKDTDLARTDEFRRWDPFAMTRQLMQWDPLFRSTRAMAEEAFMPRVEVTESDDGYLVRADVPGVREEDLELTVSGNMLTITGERRSEHTKKDERVHVHERHYGKFVRSLTLPADADADQVTADLDDGVLTLSIGKYAEAKPRKISLAQRLKNKLKS